MKNNLTFVRRTTLPVSVALLLAGTAAHAACNLTVSSASLDLGRGFTSAMPLSDVPGYRQMGVRNVTVNGQCDASQSTLRLRITGLRPLPGKPLVQWGDKDSALAFRIERASVDGAPVPMLAPGSSASALLALDALDLTQDGIVELDVSRLPATGRKSFSLQIRLTGLVAQGFVARDETRFNSNFNVQLVGAL